MIDGVDKQWLEAFQAKHGRPLRVLHIGNIAANGYLNAKFQRTIGIDADVLNIDYRHVMAFPEWEDADLKHAHGDDFNPKFHPNDLSEFQRPDWFISGNFYHCVETVRSRYELRSLSERLLAPLRVFVVRLRIKLLREAHKTATEVRKIAVKGWSAVRPALRPYRPVLLPVGRPLRWVIRWLLALGNRHKILHDRLRVLDDMKDLFRHYFPDRVDQLKTRDIASFVGFQRSYCELLEPYDIVQAYATMGYIPLIAGTKPYTTFEHGTLRDFTMQDLPLHRITALSYRHSQHAFITNGDCLAYAKALGLKSYSPMIHPINVAQHRQDFSQDVAQIRRDLGGDILIFCPARHDFEIKGTDRAIQAFKLLKDRTDKRLVLVLAAWGNDVEKSRAMIRDFGLEDQVSWQPSMCRLRMIRYLQAADVVLDQFVLPVFGSTAPQAIAAGRPIISSYDPKETAWLIPEPAPIVSATTPEEIAEKILQCVDPAWLKDYQERAKRWCDRYHAPDTALRDHLRVYKRILEDQASAQPV